jgi:transcription elongation factor
MVQNTRGQTLLNAIKQVRGIYMKQGFKLTTLLSDGQFESIRVELAKLQITLNVTSQNEHVPEIERHICKLKERV